MLLLISAALGLSCGDDGGTSPDTTPPAPVADLAATDVTQDSAELTWTAPGDNGAQGKASEYDIRYSTEAITQANWDQATECDGEAAPQASGSTESFSIGGLDQGTTYFFALKAADEVPNWSELSNVASTATTPDTTPPAPVADLAVTVVTHNSVELSWTAPGNDSTQGTAGQYDIRYSTATITPADWDQATQCTGVPAPQVSGSSEGFTVGGLTEGTEYFFALKAADGVPNWSGLSNITSATTSAVTGYVFVTSWGSTGSAAGQFDFPLDVAIDGLGYVYVADDDNHRVQKFTSDGVFVAEWGSQGTGEGQFSDFEGVAVDDDGNVYAVDSGNGRVQKFTSEGTFLVSWHLDGSGTGSLSYPCGIDVAPSGNVYVVDWYDGVNEYTSTGSPVRQWGGSGTGDGEFVRGYGVAVDRHGDVYVSDTSRNGIQKFTSEGVFLLDWGSEGPGEGQFDDPYHIAVGPAGNVYVADSRNERIQKFTSEGVFVLEWGSEGAGEGQFDYPVGVSVDDLGNVYVADSRNDRIQVFAPAP
jgi:hypothetical protein